MYVPIHPTIFQSNLSSLTDFGKISKFMKIIPVQDELFHAGGQTYTYDIANSCYSNFC